MPKDLLGRAIYRIVERLDEAHYQLHINIARIKMRARRTATILVTYLSLMVAPAPTVNTAIITTANLLTTLSTVEFLSTHVRNRPMPTSATTNSASTS